MFFTIVSFVLTTSFITSCITDFIATYHLPSGYPGLASFSYSLLLNKYRLAASVAVRYRHFLLRLYRYDIDTIKSYNTKGFVINIGLLTYRGIITSLVKCRDSRAVNSITSASIRLKVSALCKSLWLWRIYCAGSWMVMRVKTRKIPWLVLANYFWRNIQEQS